VTNNIFNLAAYLGNQPSGAVTLDFDLADAIAVNFHVSADAMQIEIVIVIIIRFASVQVLECASLVLNTDNAQLRSFFLSLTGRFKPNFTFCDAF